MYYVYILKEITKNHFYIGHSSDLKNRLKAHYNKEVLSTKHKQWKLNNYFAFNNIVIAKKFEKYLKSGSGRAFCKKHFNINEDEDTTKP